MLQGVISVVILAKDSARSLRWTLESLKGFSDVVVYDTGSKDKTGEIARAFPNVRFIEGTFEGFGTTRNRALFNCKHDWVLHIDSDEVLSPALADEILSLNLNLEEAYAMERANYFWGKRIRSCSGWYPDWVVRLYHKERCSFTEAKVHEKLDTTRARVVRLKSPLYHLPYLEVADLLTKMQHYTSLFAEEKKLKRKSSVTRALAHAGYAFMKSYLFKRGFLDGREGLILSFYQAHTAFYKYLKLLELAAPPPLPFFLGPSDGR